MNDDGIEKLGKKAVEKVGEYWDIYKDNPYAEVASFEEHMRQMEEQQGKEQNSEDETNEQSNNPESQDGNQSPENNSENQNIESEDGEKHSENGVVSSDEFSPDSLSDTFNIPTQEKDNELTNHADDTLSNIAIDQGQKANIAENASLNVDGIEDGNDKNTVTSKKVVSSGEMSTVYSTESESGNKNTVIESNFYGLSNEFINGRDDIKNDLALRQAMSGLSTDLAMIDATNGQNFSNGDENTKNALLANYSTLKKLLDDDETPFETKQAINDYFNKMSSSALSFLSSNYNPGQADEKVVEETKEEDKTPEITNEMINQLSPEELAAIGIAPEVNGAATGQFSQTNPDFQGSEIQDGQYNQDNYSNGAEYQPSDQQPNQPFSQPNVEQSNQASSEQFNQLNSQQLNSFDAPDSQQYGNQNFAFLANRTQNFNQPVGAQNNFEEKQLTPEQQKALEEALKNKEIL